MRINQDDKPVDQEASEDDSDQTAQISDVNFKLVSPLCRNTAVPVKCTFRLHTFKLLQSVDQIKMMWLKLFLVTFLNCWRRFDAFLTFLTEN